MEFAGISSQWASLHRNMFVGAKSRCIIPNLVLVLTTQGFRLELTSMCPTSPVPTTSIIEDNESAKIPLTTQSPCLPFTWESKNNLTQLE